jgi:hypothetical protein
LTKVQSGDPLRIPAQAYNAFVDAARDFQQRTAHIGQQATPQARQSGIVLVRNASGTDRGRFDVLGVNGPIIDPSANLHAFRNDVALECVTPTADHAGRFAILAEPIAAGAIGRACIAGVSIARLRVADLAEEITRAEVIDGETLLQPNEHGSTAVLWHEQATGDVWAVVRLGNAAPAWADIGFGIPADGETDVPHDADINLTVTDAAGTPILDDQGQPQTIKVWRNALKRSLYTDFDAETVFVYVNFAEPEGDVGGCIFSRTEAFKSHRDWLPPDGYPLHPDTEQPPQSTDATGNAGNASHVHVIGKMFMESDADGKGWAPWMVIDPTKFASFKVKTDAADTTGGYLNDEVTVTPAAGHSWLAKSVTPGGAADNKLLLEHNVWDEENAQASEPVPGNLAAGNGAEIVADVPQTEPYVEFQEFRDRWDERQHSMLTPQLDAGLPVKKYIKVPATVKTDADDTTSGYLMDEVIVDPPGGGPSWLAKSVDPGGAADNKLLIEHKDWDSAQTQDTVELLLSWENHGGGLSLDISQPPDGWAWLEVETYTHKRDRKGHCDLVGRQGYPLPLDPIYLKWVAVPQGQNVGDILHWDGTKWVTLAAPSGGDFVLMSSGASPYWQQVQEFQCPGSGA